MIDIRDRLYEAGKTNEKVELTYYNLQKNIWSEWGYLNFMISRPVKGLFSEADLFAALDRGAWVLVPGDDWLAELKEIVGTRYAGSEWVTAPWRRWKTKGKSAEGIPAWKDAWDSRDLSKLERNFYIVQVRK